LYFIQFNTFFSLLLALLPQTHGFSCSLTALGSLAFQRKMASFFCCLFGMCSIREKEKEMNRGRETRDRERERGRERHIMREKRKKMTENERETEKDRKIMATVSDGRY